MGRDSTLLISVQNDKSLFWSTPLGEWLAKRALVVVLLSIPALLVGQSTSYDVRFISFADGLPNRWVTCVAQDSTGLIWIGMRGGLATYDGQEFDEVTDQQGIIFSQHVKELQLTEDGYFRVYTKNYGTFRFSPYATSTNRVTIESEDFPDNSELVPKEPARLTKFYRPNTNRLVGPDFITLTDSTGNDNIHYQGTPWGSILRTSRKSPLATECSREGKTLRQILLPESVSFRSEPRFFFQGMDLFYNHLTISSEIKLVQELFWRLDETNGLHQLSFTRNGVPLEITEIDRDLVGNTFCLKQDVDQNYLLVTKNRFWIFDAKGSLIEDLSEQINKLAGIDWTPSNLFIDTADNIWLSTNTGLFLISVRPTTFKTYFQNENNTSVRGIIELDDGNILVGTDSKSRVINPNSGAITSLCLPDYCPYFNALHRTRDGELLAGSYGRAILSISEDRIIRDGYNKLNTALLVPYYHPASQTYFFGTDRGLYASARHDDNYQPYARLNGFDAIQNMVINHFHNTNSGLWIGGSSGLFLLHPTEGIIKSALSPYNIKHFYEDQQGIFWIATANAGLLRWDPTTNETRSFMVDDGLTNNTLYAVYQDNDGFLWLPSNRGLMRFNIADGNVISFQPEDGIAHEEFNTSSHFKASDGTLYFGGIDGLTAFHPSTVNLKKNDARLLIKELNQYVADSDKLENRTTRLIQDGYIEMPPGDKFFTISFNLLDYTSKNISYAWKIDGVYQDWNYQKENNVRLLGLPYGQHTLRIKARTSGSDWTDQELIIPVTVKRPFYRSFLFLLSLPFLLVLLTVGFFRYRTATLRKKSQRLQQVVEERTLELASRNAELKAINDTKDRLLAMISHDLRVPLISLRGLTQKVNFLVENNRVQEIKVIGETVDTAVARTQKLLDNLLSWAIVQGQGFEHNPEDLEVSALLRETQALYQDAAKAKNITLCIQAGNDKVIADNRSVLTILRNLVDNAIKFTPCGGQVSLSATATPQEGYISLRVKDTGVGMTTSKLKKLFIFEQCSFTQGTNGEKGTGLGLLLCADLIRLNGGEITVESTLGQGTTFHVLLPHYKR